MKRVGLVGWRGMVGSVLMQRMLEERDFDLIEPVFFTTSNVGGQGPAIGKDIPALKDAYDINELKTLRAATTPMKYSLNCAKQVGRGIGLMPRQLCA